MSSLDVSPGATTWGELSGMNHRRELIEAAAESGFSVLGSWVTTETLHPTGAPEIYGPKQLTFGELIRQHVVRPDAVIIPIQQPITEQAQSAVELSQAS